MKSRISTVAIVILALFLGLSGLGCSGMAKKDELLIAYPPPPDEPRIVYLRSMRGGMDLEPPSFLDAIFGKKAENALVKPWGVFGRKGVLYVTDSGRGVVLVMDTVQNKVRTVGDRGTGRLHTPLGVVLAPNNILFVADANLKRVYGYDSEGELKIAIGKKDELKNPAGLAIDEKLGRLYLADSYGHVIRVFSFNGEKMFEFGQRGDTPGNFNFPTNIAVDRRNSNIYVTDTQNFRVQVFDKDGKFLKSIGQLGDVPGTFSRPKGLGIDSEGHLYVVDAAFNNIQVFSEDYQILLTFGHYGAGPDEFQIPAGMYIDEDDRIYLSDQIGRKVLIYQYVSERWKKNNPEEYQEIITKLGNQPSKQ